MPSPSERLQVIQNVGRLKVPTVTYHKVSVSLIGWQPSPVKRCTTRYIDRALPCGLWSAPKIFSAVTDTHSGGYCKHYPWLYIGNWGKEWSRLSKVQLVSTLSELGVPIKHSKLKGPAYCLSFLGIESRYSDPSTSIYPRRRCCSFNRSFSHAFRLGH